jgi:hypothetical protein
MKQQELERFIQSGDVGEIVFHRRQDSWEVWIYDHKQEPPSRTCSLFGNALVAGRTGSFKLYTSLDRAWAAMRKLGFIGPISIDG